MDLVVCVEYTRGTPVNDAVMQPWTCLIKCLWTNNSNSVFNRYMLIWPLRWRHNEHDSVSNHQPHDCLLNRLFRGRSKKTSKLHVTGFCAGNSPGTGEFPAQMASNAENVSIWWRHHGERQWSRHVQVIILHMPRYMSYRCMCNFVKLNHWNQN